MDYIIRDAKQNDMKSVLGLIKELALFEREPDEVIITEDQLIKDGFSTEPKFKCFVAEVNEEVVGICFTLSKILHVEGTGYAFRRFNSN